MIPTSFGLLYVLWRGDDGVGLIFGLAAIIVVVLVGAAKFVLGGSRDAGASGITSDPDTGLVDPYAVKFSEKAAREAASNSGPRRLRSPQNLSDEHFDEIFRKAVEPLIDYHFPSKIAGAAYANSDGSSRVEALAECKVFEELVFEHEPDNPVDAKAVAVYRKEPRVQLGYLPARTAHDLLGEVESRGPGWMGILHHFNLHPETGALVGANIIVAHLEG
jgi:hypothetical protein